MFFKVIKFIFILPFITDIRANVGRNLLRARTLILSQLKQSIFWINYCDTITMTASLPARLWIIHTFVSCCK